MSTIDSGDTAWLLMSICLVFMMTPGIAFFYGGLVNSRNVLNTMMMSFMAMGIVTIQWILLGYSFGFSKGSEDGVYGDFNYGGLHDVGQEPYAPYSATIPHLVYCFYQLMFAAVSVAIISGAVVCRMKFSAWLIFIILWTTMCYDTLAHWVWSERGWLRNLGALDWAGGTVVHISTGWSALFAATILGRRKSALPSRPHNVPYVLLGATLLWFGWFGFNGGSSFGANGLGAVALVNSHISACASMLTWVAFEAILNKGRATPVGAATGVIVGLVIITPAAGYVDTIIALPLGVIGTCVTFGCMELKRITPFLKEIDDSLDVWTCHGISGVCGCILTGLFASKAVNPSIPANGLIYADDGEGIRLLGLQVMACCVTIAWAFVTTTTFLLVIKYTPFLGLYQDDENEGLDVILHGGLAYDDGELEEDDDVEGEGSEPEKQAE